MLDKLGETYRGVVSGVAPFGIFIQLEGVFVEGLVHVSGLGGTISTLTPFTIG